MGRHVRITKNRFRQLSQDVKQRADDVTELYAAQIVESAALKAPYRFGVLRASIEQAEAGAAQRRITVGAYYGIFHELGTGNISARPYLEPAVEQWRDDYVRAIGLLVNGR